MADSKSPMKPATNYFISTLGEAAECNAQAPHRFKTINQFVDQQSREIPLRPAVAFPVPHTQVGKEWGYDIFTYSDLRRKSLSTAKALSISIVESLSQHNSDPTVRAGTTVALLCPSSVDFLFTWLGLMRLGYAVLMIAWVHPGSCRRTVGCLLTLPVEIIQPTMQAIGHFSSLQNLQCHIVVL